MALPVRHEMPVIENLNPLQHMGAEEYTAWWQYIFNILLHGFWARLFFVMLIVMAFYVGVRQRNPTLAAVCIGLAAIVAYGAGAIGLMHSMSW